MTTFVMCIMRDVPFTRVQRSDSLIGHLNQCNCLVWLDMIMIIRFFSMGVACVLVGQTWVCQSNLAASVTATCKDAWPAAVAQVLEDLQRSFGVSQMRHRDSCCLDMPQASWISGKLRHSGAF